MRLKTHPGISGCSPEEVMLLIRHGVDVEILSKDLNQPLTEETKPDIRTLCTQAIRLCGEIKAKSIKLRHSNRLRAVQTAAISAEEFFAANIPTEMIDTPGVREIYQGEFVIKEDHVHGTAYKPLLDAWEVWQQKLDACELLYRFGDPLNQGGQAEYPNLLGWFLKFGENQAEFSLRLYRMLCELFADESPCLQIVVGHQASCSRIQRIISATLQLERGPDGFESGNFVRFLEKKGSRATIDPACGIAIKKPNKETIISVLEKEIKFLEDIT